MSKATYSRILNDNRHVGNFVKNILQIGEEQEFGGLAKEKLILKISAAEKQISDVIGLDTLNYRDNRIAPYDTDEARQKLRRKIYNELVNNVRLDDDDKISLGCGGALPKTELRKEKHAFYIIGLPASGKSEVSNLISDEFGAMILDSDYAKRKFPEYDIDFGAAVVHEESAVTVFGGQGKFANEPSVLQYAVQNGCNIVIPKIGDISSKVKDFAEGLVGLGYTVHLVLVRLDRRKAVERACHRFVKTGRYVSLPLIFDVYSNDPTITFYDLEKMCTCFSSYTMISSDVPLGEVKQIIYKSESSPIPDDMFVSCKEGAEIEC